MMGEPLSKEQLKAMNAYWRAANYLSVGQIYMYDNPLLKEPLRLEHIKPRLLGHWGTTPGLNFIYVHLNRIIKAYDLNMIFITGPGHGGPGEIQLFVTRPSAKHPKPGSHRRQLGGCSRQHRRTLCIGPRCRLARCRSGLPRPKGTAAHLSLSAEAILEGAGWDDREWSARRVRATGASAFGPPRVFRRNGQCRFV